MNAVEIAGLRHEFAPSRRGGAPRLALDGVAFTVGKGEVFGLLGPNGGGKTTLFRVLSTALRPTAGSARVFGADVLADPAAARRRLGVVFQHPSLDGKLTLWENLLTQGRIYGLTRTAIETRAGDLFARLKLADRAQDFVEKLSGGLQRRGEIAKGLLHSPELLLLDEPSTGLDPGARRDLWQVIDDLRREGVTVLVTTHLMEEAEHCDRLALLNHGRLVAMESPAALKETIGGDVITVQTAAPDDLCEKVRVKFGGAVRVVDGTVRIERAKGHAFVPQLVEAFPGLVESVTVGKPTLEDVFIEKTGHRFWHEDEGAAS